MGNITDSKRATQMLIDESKSSPTSPKNNRLSIRRTQSVLEIESDFTSKPSIIPTASPIKKPYLAPAVSFSYIQSFQSQYFPTRQPSPSPPISSPSTSSANVTPTKVLPTQSPPPSVIAQSPQSIESSQSSKSPPSQPSSPQSSPPSSPPSSPTSPTLSLFARVANFFTRRTKSPEPSPQTSPSLSRANDTPSSPILSPAPSSSNIPPPEQKPGILVLPPLSDLTKKLRPLSHHVEGNKNKNPSTHGKNDAHTADTSPYRHSVVGNTTVRTPPTPPPRNKVDSANTNLINNAQPIPIDTKPIPIDAKPIPIDAKPIPIDAKPIPTDDKPTDPKPIPTDSKPIPTDTKPIDAKPVGGYSSLPNFSTVTKVIDSCLPNYPIDPPTLLLDNSSFRAKSTPSPKARPTPPPRSKPSPIQNRSPKLSSPSQGHIPPNRPLPPAPLRHSPSVDDQRAPLVRRATVQADLGDASTPWVSPTPAAAKKRVSLSIHRGVDQVPVLSTAREGPPVNHAEPPCSTPKENEVTLLPSKPQVFFYQHIPAPPVALLSNEMRERIANEILTTEYEYLNDLYTLVCAKSEMEKFLHKNELSSVFNNIDQIYKVNDTIYRRMLGLKYNGADKPSSAPEVIVFSSVDDKIKNISRTFLGLSHTLKIYAKYSLGHQRAFDKLNHLFETEEFGTLLQDIESMPGFKAAKMSSFLIKPVQRICRYPLLLKELVKSTPSDHSTYIDLQEALENMELTIEEINEAQRQIERELNLMRAQQELRLFGMDLDIMSPTRTLVLDGPILLVPVLRKTNKVHKTPKEGYYFLFDDFFLFIRRTKKTQVPHIFIPTDHALVTDPGENAIEIVHVGDLIWMFVLPTYHDKVFLFQKLEQLIADNARDAAAAGQGLTSSDKSPSRSALNIATLTRSGTMTKADRQRVKKAFGR